MDVEPDPLEAARRLRAAIAYVDISQAEAAKLFGVSVATLARMLDKKGQDGVRRPTWGELWRFADALGIPRAWFTADIARIHQIVPDDLPSFPNDVGDFAKLRPSAVERGAAAAREERALQREAQRSSARQQASPRTKREPKRRRNGDG